MKISVPVFRGEFPRFAPRALPNEAAQEAINTRLLSNNVEPYRNFSQIATLCKEPEINTIFLLDGQYWLHWNYADVAADVVEVDCARSIDGDDATGRVFLTGLDIPRYTTVALANSGSGCLPHETRPLGVPNPETAPTVSASLGGTVSVDYQDDGSKIESWDTVGTISSGTQIRYVTTDTVTGNPAPSYQMVQQASPTNTWMYRDAGLGSSSQMSMEVDFYVAAATTAGTWSAGLRLGCTSSGAGPALSVSRGIGGAYALILSNATGYEVDGTVSSVTPSAIALVTWHKLKLTLSRNPNGTLAAVGQVLDSTGTTVLGTVTGDVYSGGGGIMLAAANNSAWSAGPTSILYDNISVQGSGSFNDPSDDYTTAYVYTWVNDLGEESGPSPASSAIVKDDGTTVTVTTPTSPGSGYDYYVVAKRIYRAITTLAGTSYYFLAEQLVSYTTYEDDTTNSAAALNETLGTTGYALPPSDLRGIIALPNSIYAGFSGRNLCLSAIGQPHAWPVENRYAIDTDIVAIGNIDSQVVILGGSTPYLAGGNDPANFSMVSTEVPQGCTSKRARAYLKGFGVVYASPDGLVAVAGTGQVTLLSQGVISRKEWQELNPASMIFEAHDNRLFIFFSPLSGSPSGMIFDASESGFGKVTLNFHATAMYADRVTDRIYMVLDENFPPVIGSPVGSQATPDGITIFAFDEYDGAPSEGPVLSDFLPYLWHSKRYLQPWRQCFRYACVRAESYDYLWFQLYADGSIVHEQQVLNADAFVLPDTDANYVDFILIGTDSVESVEIADDVSELGI